jgi:SAM-dependent methyltransferase
MKSLLREFGTKTFAARRIIADLRSEVQLPAGKSGNCEITHKHETGPFTVVSHRNSLFSKFAALKAGIEGGLLITELKEDGLVWMRDHPQEIFLHHYAIDAAKGKVLIGGLGIGYSAQAIARKYNVSDVVVVEKSRHVIKLVSRYLKYENIQVLQADIFDYLKTSRLKFDFVFLDIWRSTGEWEFTKTVLPLRKLAKRVLNPNGKIMCWGEEEMRGQVRDHRNGRKLYEKLKTQTHP